jgi:hypothetical protein
MKAGEESEASRRSSDDEHDGSIHAELGVK